MLFGLPGEGVEGSRRTCGAYRKIIKIKEGTATTTKIEKTGLLGMYWIKIDLDRFGNVLCGK